MTMIHLEIRVHDRFCGVGGISLFISFSLFAATGSTRNVPDSVKFQEGNLLEEVCLLGWKPR
jgi:tRNA/tmRNA/rRNA uracil-C5-methylase (TrmA/RlmC/RlmD family)